MFDITTTILGAVQGITEFLPISSSGHLFLTELLLDTSIPFAFDILLHVATLAAVLIYTFPLIVQMIHAIFRVTFQNKSKQDDPNTDIQLMRLFVTLCITTLFTAPIGLLLRDIVENTTLTIVGTCLLVTAFFLVLPFLLPRTRVHITRTLRTYSNNPVPTISYINAIILGLAQGFAVLPGISRSGTTISIAVLLGLSYAHATKYSFLMAIPAILASFVLNIKELPSLITQISAPTLVLSMLVAFVCGLLGLKWLTLIAKRGKIWYFSIYLVIIGVLVLI